MREIEPIDAESEIRAAIDDSAVPYTVEWVRPNRHREQAVKTNDSAAARFLLGFQYAYLGHPKEAVRELDKAIALNAKDKTAEELRSLMAAKLNPADAAVIGSKETPEVKR
ncbi:MAG TPA: hypothetical protein VNH11_10790 [Pirellulales bacterium]|nr:hypothetical protein [Pirellulales bacterium]